MKLFGQNLIFLKRVNIFSGGPLHTVKQIDQLAQLILITDSNILLLELALGNAPISCRKLLDRRDDRAGSQTGKSGSKHEQK